MPYGIEKSGEKYKVVNKNTKRVFGTHDSKEDADAQLRALYANADPKNESEELSEVQQLEESNSYLRTIAKRSGLSKESLTKLWNECIVEQEKTGKSLEDRMKSKPVFWKGVRQKFDTKILELDTKEAKYIMDSRQRLKHEIESFLDSMANDNYSGAKDSMPKMLSTKIGIMIDDRRETFLKELGDRTKNKAKESQ